MKIRFEKESNKDNILRDYQNCRLDNTFLAGNEYGISNTYSIFDDNNHIGYITVSPREDDIFIELIELFSEYRRFGYGSKVVNEMFDFFGVSKISGESLSSAIPFWYNLGAKFFISDDELKYCYNNCETAFFELG